MAAAFLRNAYPGFTIGRKIWLAFVAVGSILPILAVPSPAQGPAQGPSPAVSAPTEQPDNYVWLEEVNGARPLDWVKTENARTAKVMEADPRFAQLQAKALQVAESPVRLPAPVFYAGMIYNTWQDAQHVRGILRKTTLADYLTPEPHWETVIDYDALAKSDKESWVHHGLNCLYPDNSLCLVGLSAGGEDAETLREFDLRTGKFVEGGFVLPRSKQSVSWLDKDTLLVARDWGAGTMTASGYPFVTKLWKRGQPLEQATEIYRGKETDESAEVQVFNDAQGHTLELAQREVDFFTSEYSLLTPEGPKRIELPGKSQVNDLLDGQLIVSLKEDWKPSSRSFGQGSVVSLDLAALQKDPEHLAPTVVFAPTAQEFEQWTGATKNHLLMTTLDHVQGRAYVYSRSKDGGWTRRKLEIPDNQTVYVSAIDPASDRYFLTVEGFLTPSTLQAGDASTVQLKVAKTLPALFDASKDVVEQLEVASKDGARVPYFVVHRKDIQYNGANPTILSAYGGFEISSTPHYSAATGKLWLEQGGVFVLANIRGGEEFGPAWHEAGLKTHRQRIYDDFAAVGQDLVARKITSPRRLGIIGGSNGGLLMGVEMEQHPEMWRAVVIEIPLLDMLGFEHIAAGASWVGEYGSVSVPEERRFLASISPYNNLRADVAYPEPLIFTTTKDDRVGPVHARKFAARMEEMHKPFFYDEIVEGGHGAGADLKEQARTVAEFYLYFTRKLVD
jgi:prolyl oligopeptidase